MKFCTHCGAALSDDSLFCEDCGTQRPTQTAPNAPCLQSVQKESVVVGERSPSTVPTTTKKRRRIFFLIAILLIAAVVIYIFVPGTGTKSQAPFFGIERGDTAEKVEKQMGTPDDFEDNGLRNFNYYYDDIEFLNMNGYVKFHFELNKVATLSFVCATSTMRNYNSVFEHYTNKYGEPESAISDYSDYYYESERSWWVLEDGTTLMIEYHSGSTYEKPALTISIYK